jgi:predicted O-methyltransferase YrrM
LDIVDKKIDEYLTDRLAVQDPILREMGEYGSRIDFPIIGPQVGRLMFLLAKSINAKKVLELGSGFGYSAMWFALALGDGGQVVMTEGSDANSARARGYFARAGLTNRVVFNVGDALKIAAALAGPFDVVFCDIDKHQYPQALPMARSKLRVGGYFICDNMLRRGSVLSPVGASDANTRGILELTRQLMQASDFYTTILPLRDGVSLSLRLV